MILHGQAVAHNDHKAPEHDHHHAHDQHQHGNGHHHENRNPGPSREESITPSIPDPVLIDQDGNKHRFYSDLVKGNLVLMNSIYTTCEGTCPMQTAIFSLVRKLLGDRLGREIQMISVSLDPATDTPERLKKFAEQHGGASEGWTFLTGSRKDVARVLKAMDLYSANPEEHTPIAAVGNEPGGVWLKVINLNSPVELVSRLDFVKTKTAGQVGVK